MSIKLTAISGARHFFFALSLALAVVAVPASAAAQEWDSIVVRVGGLWTDFGTNLRIDPVGRLGTDLDLEDDLGLEGNATTVFADGLWRITRRNQLRATFFTANRDVSRAVIDRTITVGDKTFNVNAQVDAYVDTRYLSVDYGYAFVANPKAEVGVTIGLTAATYNAGVGLTRSVSGSDEVSRDLTDAQDFTAPIPLPGLFTNLKPHPRVTLLGTMRFIKASIGKYDAGVFEARAGGDIRVAGPLSLGAAYYYNRARVERDGAALDGKIVYAFGGIEFHGALGF